MRSFSIYTNESSSLNPAFSVGGSSTGPGLDQYIPVADLNAQSEKEVKKSDLDQIEKYADRLFASLDIDVEFTRHFLDRVNDERNVKQITPSELTRLFKQTYKKHGKTISKLGSDAEAVINDMKTDINMPFVLNVKGGELELVAKTVMRKKNFKTPNRKLSFEEFKFFPKKVHKQITLPEPPTNLQRELDIVKKIMAARTPEDEESIKNHDETPFYAIQEYCKENGLEFHDGEFEDIVESVIKPILHFKKKFNRPRPFQVDKDIKPYIETNTTKTRSYPSGHACQSMIVAKYVAGKFPTHEKEVIVVAKKGGMTRVQAGFHFLSDYVAGNLLAEKLYILLNKDEYKGD